MGLLDSLIFGTRDWFNEAGSIMPRRSRVQVVGGSLVDDPANDRLVLTTTPGGGESVGPVITNTGTGTLNDVDTVQGGVRASEIRFTSATPIMVTGFDATIGGHHLIVRAVNATLTLSNLGGSSASFNQILTGTGSSVVIPAGGTALIGYDDVSQKWGLVSGSGSPPAGNDGSIQYKDGTSFGGSLSSMIEIASGALILAATLANTPSVGDLRFNSAGTDAAWWNVTTRNGANDADLTVMQAFNADNTFIGANSDFLAVGFDASEDPALAFHGIYWGAKKQISSYLMTIPPAITSLWVGQTFQEWPTGEQGMALDAAYNVALFTRATHSTAANAFGGGQGVLFLGNANTVPTTNPSSGIILYTNTSSAIALKYRRPTGKIVDLELAYDGKFEYGVNVSTTGPSAFSFGTDVATSQSFGFSAGYQITNPSAGGVAIGEVITLSGGANQHAIGYNHTFGADTTYSTSIGFNNIVAANTTQVTVLGAQGFASMPGEVAFGGAGLGLGYHVVAMNRDINATSDYLRNVSGTGLILQAFATYEVIVHLEANSFNDAKRAIETYVVRVHNQNGGVGYVDSVERRGRRAAGLEAHGWTMTFSHAGGNELRMTFNAGADNCRVHAIVEWMGRGAVTGDTTGSALGTVIVPYVTESSLTNGYVPVYNSTTRDWVATDPATFTGSVPTGTGFRHITGGVEDGTAKLVVNADVDAAAAIAGTKISPDFGSQNVKTTGYLYNSASTVATVGFIRFPSSALQMIAAKNSVANDVVALAQNGDALYVGSNHDLANSYSNIRIWSAGGGDVGLGGGGTTQFLVNSSGSGSYQNANLGVYGGSASFPSVGGGAGVFAVGNVGTAPTSSPSGGFVLWSGSGNMEIRTPTSARVTIGDYVSVFTTVASAATTGAYRLTNTSGIYYRTTTPNDALLIGSSGAAGIAIGDGNTSGVTVTAGTAAVALVAATNITHSAGAGAYHQFSINASNMMQIENGAIRHAGNIQGMLGPVKYAITSKAFSALTDYTLTTGESEALFLIFTDSGGGPGSGTKNIILPDAPGALYYVDNRMSATYVDMKKSGGTAVTVANGEACFIWHDGTDYIRATAVI